MAEQLVGKVTHYYSRIGVAAIELEAPLSTGALHKKLRGRVNRPSTSLS